jgi:hypothetical protein
MYPPVKITAQIQTSSKKLCAKHPSCTDKQGYNPILPAPSTFVEEHHRQGESAVK